MAYDSDDIADKLRSLKGSDFQDFDQEDLDKMYRSSMVEPKKISDGWTKDQRNSYRLMYGQDELDKADNDVDYSKYGNLDKPRGTGAEMRMLFGDGGVENFRTGKLTEEQEMWDAARERAGIKKVNSMSDIAEIRDKVNREMMGRMTGLGMSAMAKDEDIAAPPTTADKPEFKESPTFTKAKESVADYQENNLTNYGSDLFGSSQDSFDDNAVGSSGTPSEKDYLNGYKFNVANSMKPVGANGEERSSVVQKFKNKQKEMGLI